MKTLIAILAVSVATVVAAEIESIDSEQLGKIARRILSDYGSPADVPVATDVDVEKAAGLKGGEAGLIAMPDKKLSAESLATISDKPVTFGQLWMHKVVPAIGGSAPSAAKLRTVEVGDEHKKVEVYYLTAAKSPAGVVELSLISAGKEPLVKVPLVKTDAAESATPFSVSAQKDGEQSGVLVLSVFGSYKADIPLTKSAQ
ncbi:MAG: hypothetical protein RL088_1917 [Verrucomicrobiota bacterium]|jgi:hypothetical protein